jgi:hypothetical protein
MADESRISPEDQKRILRDLVGRIRVARLAWQHAEIEAKERLAVADAGMETADGTLALREAKQVLERGKRSLKKYQALTKELNDLVVYGKRPAS